MKQLKRNKQKMYYSAPLDSIIQDSNGNKLIDNNENYIVSGGYPLGSDTEDIYARDEDGNIIYTQVDGVDYPVVIETKEYYDAPRYFYANISFNSGETRIAEYGLNDGDYSAIISANKGELPFTERTLIWHESEPQVDERGHAIPESADYRVVAIKTSINEERFILRKRVEGGEGFTPPSV